MGLYIQVVNTTPNDLSDMAIEVSVWDLEGACQYYEVFDKLTVPSKKTTPTVEMKYPKSENPEPVYFLLLKLYKTSDYEILSRNFYWLHLPGGDYKLLEPYKQRQVSLKITSLTSIRGSSYEVRMHIENTSKKQDSRSLLQNSNAMRQDTRNPDTPPWPDTEEKQKQSLFLKMLKNFRPEGSRARVAEISGTETGVAFFLRLSVHTWKEDKEDSSEDSRILPVHYSDNYFSVVPGEVMTVTLNFEVPQGVTPRVMINGWNYQSGQTVL